MAPFDPVSAAIGGALIGLAATLLMLLTGRIAGISGILGDLVDLAGGDRAWRLAFLAGLIAAPLVLAAGRARAIAPRPMPGWIVVASLPACWSDSARGSAAAAPRATASAASRGFRRARSSPP